METLKSLGYTVDPVKLQSEALKVNGSFSPAMCEFFDVFGTFVVTAYRAGLNGEQLQDTFPYLVEVSA